jgi:hypothetical protein
VVNEHCCGFCGRTFMPDEGQPTCASCPLSGRCSLLRCPHCGYENAIEPEWLLRVRGWFGSATVRPSAARESAEDRKEVACR